ncbi:U11/U12 small nuclear ribonucleoprotein 25 kDa protein-like [Ostrinia furnacalis]|uniref:U11/U12 small nuclear ribonucleoprotein 25 kDa protein-like n=1 Tax=Ostrinia furnacalis TaxID=93504 RepID=UPI00103B7FBB|nr:U11/U12 small nuclear ribonucleoprotein 25 kDa protein-like [Ostrinia furnacalis]
MNEIADTLSHDDLIEVTNSSITALLKSDTLLCDLPSDVILEEVISQIAVEHGQSITINVSREDEPALKVIVPQNATVIELKKAIARHFEIYQSRMRSKVKISWKYIWKTYDLNYDGIILDSDYSHIDDYGVCNKVTLTFKKRKKKKKNS